MMQPTPCPVRARPLPSALTNPGYPRLSGHPGIMRPRRRCRQWGSGIRIRPSRPATGFPCGGYSPSLATPGSHKTPAADGVDRRRSAGGLGARSNRPFGRDIPRPVRGAERHAAVATVPGIPEEEFLARTSQRRKGASGTDAQKQRRVSRHGDVVSELYRAVREVEAAARLGRVTPAVRAKYQAVALLLRDE